MSTRKTGKMQGSFSDPYTPKASKTIYLKPEGHEPCTTPSQTELQNPEPQTLNPEQNARPETLEIPKPQTSTSRSLDPKHP